MVTTAADFPISADEVGERLSRIFGHGIRPGSDGAWSCAFDDPACWTSLLADAGPERREEGELAEQALEIVRPLTDLGYSGTITAEAAARYLTEMGKLKYVRLARRAHPNGSGKLVVAALVTLYLAELDDDEIRAALGELRSADVDAMVSGL